MKPTRMVLLFLLALSPVMVSIGATAAQNQNAQKPGEAQKKTAKAALIDVNSASAADLKKLNGIGDVYANKIIKNRPYRGKNEIVTKAGVPQKTYDTIKDKIIAKQPLNQLKLPPTKK